MTRPTNKTLGQMLAEQSVALRRRHGFHRVPMPADAAVIDRTVKIPPVDDSGQPLNRADARARSRMRRRIVGRVLSR